MFLTKGNPSLFIRIYSGYLGYKVIYEDEETLGMAGGTVGIWIMATPERYKVNKFHRKATGLNHLAFRVGLKDDVDKFDEEFIKKNGLKTLYDTPKYFPEYSPRDYAVFFEDPDRVKLEVMTM